MIGPSAWALPDLAVEEVALERRIELPHVVPEACISSKRAATELFGKPLGLVGDGAKMGEQVMPLPMLVPGVGDRICRGRGSCRTEL